MLRKYFILSILLLISLAVHAQDFDFSFDFDDDEDNGTGSFSGSSGSSAGRSPVTISGDVSASITGYLEEISEGPEHINTRDMFNFSGKINFRAQSAFAEGVINLKLVPALVPVSIDEAYIRAFFGNLDVTAGLRKLTWGKADQFGPLDVINLPDQSKIFVEMADSSSLMSVKIANPVIHTALRFGQSSKLEGVFLPSFEIVSMAVSSALSGSNNLLTALTGYSSTERWMPEQMLTLNESINQMITASGDKLKVDDILKMPDTSGLDYAQAGLRFTTTVGSADIGFQYFYGRMFQPAVKINAPSDMMPFPTFEFLFNKYHQIGFDYAQVLAGFNIRAEIAANITEDAEGNDGFIYNPSIGWSFGFDRDVAGVNFNLQANGSVRLLDDKVGSSSNPFTADFGINPNYDIESGKSMTATRLTAMLSKKFLRDEFELRSAVVWGIEDKDFAVIPALIWAKDDLRAAFSGGFFLGDKNGQIGQYFKNNFFKISINYMF